MSKAKLEMVIENQPVTCISNTSSNTSIMSVEMLMKLGKIASMNFLTNYKQV